MEFGACLGSVKAERASDGCDQDVSCKHTKWSKWSRKLRNGPSAVCTLWLLSALGSQKERCLEMEQLYEAV